VIGNTGHTPIYNFFTNFSQILQDFAGSQSIKPIRTENQEFLATPTPKPRGPHRRMKKVRRTFTLTETVERLLVVSKRGGTREDCPSCTPGAGWITLDEAAMISGWSTGSLLGFILNGELHCLSGPQGVRLICAISLALKILKGEEDDETQNT
jgi:hypothetical protein